MLWQQGFPGDIPVVCQIAYGCNQIPMADEYSEVN